MRVRRISKRFKVKKTVGLHVYNNIGKFEMTGINLHKDGK